MDMAKERTRRVERQSRCGLAQKPSSTLPCGAKKMLQSFCCDYYEGHDSGRSILYSTISFNISINRLVRSKCRMEEGQVAEKESGIPNSSIGLALTRRANWTHIDRCRGIYVA